jgi:hypothetical protein
MLFMSKGRACIPAEVHVTTNLVEAASIYIHAGIVAEEWHRWDLGGMDVGGGKERGCPTRLYVWK